MRHVIFSLLYIPILALGIITISLFAMCYVLMEHFTRFWTGKQ